MKQYKTTGEVAKEIGISTRELKYYREQGYFKPSKTEIHGNKTICYYDSNDIQHLSQVKLYKELGYTTKQIKEIFEEKDFDKKQILNSQIRELRKQKKHIQNLLIVAEIMSMIYTDDDNENIISLEFFDGNLDLFARNMFGIFKDDGEENIEQTMLEFRKIINENFTVDVTQQMEIECNSIIKIFKEIRHIVQSYDKNNTFSVKFCNCVINK